MAGFSFLGLISTCVCVCTSISVCTFFKFNIITFNFIFLNGIFLQMKTKGLLSFYIHTGFFPVAQWWRICLPVKEMKEMRVRSLDWEDPLEKEMATNSSILAWKDPMDRGAWQSTVHCVTKSGTWLRDWPSSHTQIEYTYTHDVKRKDSSRSCKMTLLGTFYVPFSSFHFLLALSIPSFAL